MITSLYDIFVAAFEVVEMECSKIYCVLLSECTGLVLCPFGSDITFEAFNRLQAKEAELVKEKDNIKNMLDEKDKLTEQIKTMDER